MARRLGAQESWISAVRVETPEDESTVPASLEGMGEGWKAALRFGELVAASGHAVTDRDYRELSRHWNEEEIVEVTLVAGLFSYFNRFNDALRVEVTR